VSFFHDSFSEPAAPEVDRTQEETVALVRELDYYGLLNYVLPRQVEAELKQWSTDFADVFSIERYHHKVAQLWVAQLGKEADIAGIRYVATREHACEADVTPSVIPQTATTARQ
jgi:hypothetical protein